MKGFLKRFFFISAILLLPAVLTNSCYDEYIVNPKLNTIEISDTDIASTTAILKGEFLWVGNQKLVEYGIEVSKNTIFNPNLRFANPAPPAAGTYQVEATGLQPNTLYYYKAYVTINTAQLYSQNVKTFTTKPE